jgi:8-oxo-dGTP diphosphatase
VPLPSTPSTAGSESAPTRRPTSEGPLQFGRAEVGLAYAERPAAFGIAARGGLIAVVRVEKPQGTWRDLPGGAIEPGEDEIQALVREFGEETGLLVEPAALVARADQYFFKTDGQPVNNRAGIYAVRVVGEDPARKVEADHTLEWRDPVEALSLLRHDSHAWALTAWLRRGGARS